MYDDFLLNNNSSASQEKVQTTNLDNLFSNLTNDINTFSKYVDDINNKKKENTQEELQLFEERRKIEKSRLEFEEYIKTRQIEYDKKIGQIDDYLNSQKQNLLRTESEFKMSMDNSLKELEIARKELEMQKEKFNEEKKQFESYKELEFARIKNAEGILESEKNQFEKYKEVSNKRIELENKNLEQKADRFKDLINQFNSRFKPALKEEEEV